MKTPCAPKHAGPKLAGPSAPGLYLVATPIGNAADITLRALECLRNVDVIACEDTRTTKKLLAIHNIDTRLTPYHEHNAARAGPNLIARLRQGQKIALVSDAGTPLISDPGYRLVRACVDNDIAVTALPGPSAVLTALTLSGLPTDRFMFVGFTPSRSGARRRFLAEVATVQATLVFLESARRLAASLDDMANILGDREAAVGRELTKMFEETRRATLSDLAAHYKTAGAPKGEIVVVVAPPDRGSDAVTDDELDAMISGALKTDSLRDAVQRIAAQTGVARRRVYDRALALTGNKK